MDFPNRRKPLMFPPVHDLLLQWHKLDDILDFFTLLGLVTPSYRLVKTLPTDVDLSMKLKLSMLLESSLISESADDPKDMSPKILASFSLALVLMKRGDEISSSLDSVDDVEFEISGSTADNPDEIGISRRYDPSFSTQKWNSPNVISIGSSRYAYASKREGG